MSQAEIAARHGIAEIRIKRIAPAPDYIPRKRWVAQERAMRVYCCCCGTLLRPMERRSEDQTCAECWSGNAR